MEYQFNILISTKKTNKDKYIYPALSLCGMINNIHVIDNTVICFFYYFIYHFNVGVQRHRSVFNSHIAQEISRYRLGNIMGKRFANDFDTKEPMRFDLLY